MSDKNELIPPKKLMSEDDCTCDELKNIVKTLANDKAFQECQTFRAQCGRLNDLFRSNPRNVIPYSTLGKIFNPPVNKSSIQQQIVKIKISPLANGRPSDLTDEQMIKLHNWITTECWPKKYYPTFEDVEDKILEFFNKTPTYHLVRKLTKKYNYNVVLAEPMEEERVMYDESAVQEYIKEVSIKIIGVRRGFLFNCDESGESDFVDARKTFVICDDNTYHGAFIPVSRAARKLTVLHTIASDGEWIKPLFVVPRKTLATDIYQELAPGSFEIQHQNKGFLNAGIFAYWFKTIFIPYLKEKRMRLQYDGPALLILDGFSGHTKVTDIITEEMRKELNLRIVYIPPHTSDQFQPLDLVIFGVQKQKNMHIKKTQYKYGEISPDVYEDAKMYHFEYQSKHLVDVYRSLWQASDVHNVTQSFKLAGFGLSDVALNKITNKLEQYHFYQPVYVKKSRSDLSKVYNNLLEVDHHFAFIHAHMKSERIWPPEKMKLLSSKIEEMLPYFHQILSQNKQNE